MYTPSRAKLWIPAYTGVRRFVETPAMGDLPIGLYDHRVMLVGTTPVIFGGFTTGNAQTKRTWKAVTGDATPTELGQMVTWHAATNNQQGMGWVHTDGRLSASGDPVGGQSNRSDILDLSTGTWSQGFNNGLAQGLSGVSPVLALNWHWPFMAWGDWFSVAELLIMDQAGRYWVVFGGGSPLNPPRPFTKLVFDDGRYIWMVNGSENVPGQITLLRIDTFQQALPLVGFNAAAAFPVQSWWANYACGLKYQGIDSLFFIFGGCEGNGNPASDRVWMLDTINPLVPVTTAMAPMPRVRCRATCHQLDNGLIAVIGGGDSSVVATSVPTVHVDLFDPGGNAWYAGPDLPQGAIWRHSSVKMPTGNIMIVGGNKGGTTASKEIWYLKKDGFSFTKVDE